MAPTPILDHIVILVPHVILTNLPSWLTDAFTVLDGGRHADGVTENKLVLLQDGVYLEIIAFVPGQEEGRERHRWGRRSEGHIVDWANTLHSEEDLETIRSRVGAAKTGITYTSPNAGGRIRPDGTELKWIISSPVLDEGKGGFVGGEAPFWCLDRTPRDLRVPYHVGGNARHASGAVGVHRVTVSVRDEGLFQTLKGTYDALQGQAGTRVGIDGDEAKISWPLRTLESVRGESSPGELVLVKIDPGYFPDGSGPVSVRLTLVSSTGDGYLAGHLGDGNWPIRFELVGST